MISKNNSPKVLFLALDTYSKLGGLQRFNQRVVTALSELALDANWPKPLVRLMRDTAVDLPSSEFAEILAFGDSRLNFIISAIRSAFYADMLLVGQINLLPLAALLKILRPRLRVILFVHGVEVWNEPVYRKRRFYEPLLLKSVGTVASVSEYTATRMATEFNVPEQNFSLFPNAVDVDVSDEVSARGANVLCVTRMASHDHGKHVDMLLDAFVRVADRVPNAKLDIVGDGVLRPELEAQALRLGLSNSVVFHGRVDDEALTSLYQGARVFALPSSKEGFGIVFLEAWTHGLAVICGNQGAAPEVVTHGSDGLVADLASPHSLANHLETLLLDPALAESMGSRGLQKVKSKYSHAHFRDNLKNLLGGVL